MTIRNITISKNVFRGLKYKIKINPKKIVPMPLWWIEFHKNYEKNKTI